ncbi:MAG: hypothetical protein PVF33_00140 [Candidatus Latescibacterota bacterium]|jgi:hypothetical protein
MKTVAFTLALCVVASVAVAGSATDGIRQSIGRAYGLDGWDTVEELRYTFNVRAGEREVRRSWVWRVKDGTVTFRDEVAGTEPFTYSLDEVGDDPPEELKAVDHRFINDQYWLLFALHVAWDTDAAVVVDEEAPLPFGNGTATKVTVQYPQEGGYTPGDAYDIYIDSGLRITHWVYRQGGQEEPSMATTWEDQKRFGPLLIPTRFRWEDGSVKIWFSGVEVKAAGGDD